MSKKAYQRVWHAENRARRRERMNNRRQEKRGLIDQIKLEQGCVDCGYSEHAIALDFDHLSDKEFSISKMVAHGYSWERILTEIEKCEVVCANCHRVRTKNRL